MGDNSYIYCTFVSYLKFVLWSTRNLIINIQWALLDYINVKAILGSADNIALSCSRGTKVRAQKHKNCLFWTFSTINKIN
jgi:hypothetical protein